MEDVEDVIVSSGPNTWPNWRNFSDRIIQPGDIVFMDLAALTWNGYKSCYYRTYCVGKEPTQEQKDVYATALKWLYDSIDAVKAGTTTREIASKWPSAKEAWGYEEEDQAAANLWGHGLGLAQYDPPVISRIWSLDHPIEIKAGMVFALETQHGKMYQWGVRIEEMLIVHEDSIEIISNFPVEQITVVDPMPGYSCCVLKHADVRGRMRYARPALSILQDRIVSMSEFIVPISAPQAMDAGRFGPEGRQPCALGNAGLPIPEGFAWMPTAIAGSSTSSACMKARAECSVPRTREARRHALDMKLGLIDQPICPEILEPLLAARRI